MFFYNLSLLFVIVDTDDTQTSLDDTSERRRSVRSVIVTAGRRLGKLITGGVRRLLPTRRSSTEAKGELFISDEFSDEFLVLFFCAVY